MADTTPMLQGDPRAQQRERLNAKISALRNATKSFSSDFSTRFSSWQDELAKSEGSPLSYRTAATPARSLGTPSQTPMSGGQQVGRLLDSLHPPSGGEAMSGNLCPTQPPKTSSFKQAAEIARLKAIRQIFANLPEDKRRSLLELTAAAPVPDLAPSDESTVAAVASDAHTAKPPTLEPSSEVVEPPVVNSAEDQMAQTKLALKRIGVNLEDAGEELKAVLQVSAVLDSAVDDQWLDKVAALCAKAEKELDVAEEAVGAVAPEQTHPQAEVESSDKPVKRHSSGKLKKAKPKSPYSFLVTQVMKLCPCLTPVLQRFRAPSVKFEDS